jgi:hypothetical protein
VSHFSFSKSELSAPLFCARGRACCRGAEPSGHDGMRAGAERRRRLQAHCGLSDSAARRSQCGGRAKEKLNGPAERAMMRSRRLSDCRRAESGGRPELTRTGVGCWGTGTASHPSPLVGLAAPRRSARICTAGANPISNAHSGRSFARRTRSAHIASGERHGKCRSERRGIWAHCPP